MEPKIILEGRLDPIKLAIDLEEDQNWSLSWPKPRETTLKLGLKLRSPLFDDSKIADLKNLHGKVRITIERLPGSEPRGHVIAIDPGNIGLNTITSSEIKHETTD